MRSEAIELKLDQIPLPVCARFSPVNHRTTITHIHLSLSSEVCDRPDYAEHYHIFCTFVTGFICVPALG
jgi:hypothetical protein